MCGNYIDILYIFAEIYGAVYVYAEILKLKMKLHSISVAIFLWHRTLFSKLSI